MLGIEKCADCPFGGGWISAAPVVIGNAALGAGLEELTDEQTAYLSGWQEGT